MRGIKEKPEEIVESFRISKNKLTWITLINSDTPGQLLMVRHAISHFRHAILGALGESVVYVIFRWVLREWRYQTTYASETHLGINLNVLDAIAGDVECDSVKSPRGLLFRLVIFSIRIAEKQRRP